MTTNDTAPTWATQLAAANKLADENTKELRRHASVSAENRHRCEGCFTCAALTVLEERMRLSPGALDGADLDPD